MAAAVVSVRHVGVVVTNLDRSLVFYRDLLGLRETRTMHESGDYVDTLLGLRDASVVTIKLAAPSGETLVELLAFGSPKATNVERTFVDPGPTHIAFTVGNLETFVDRLAEAGVRFTAPPQISPDGCAKVTFCFDPDGTPIELVEMLDADRRTA